MDEQARVPSAPTVTWRALLPLCLVAFATLTHASAIGPLAVAIARDLGVAVPLIGQVSTLIFVAMAAAGLLAGPLADHVGHRSVLLAGLVLLATSAVAMGLAPTYPAMLAGGLAAGVGATVLGIVFAFAASRHAGDARRLALARIQSAQTAGSILGAPLLTAVAAALAWRASYAVVLVAYLTALVLVARGLPRDPRPNGRFTARAALAAYRPLLADRNMLALYGASVLRAVGWLGPSLYLGAYYVGRGLSLRQVGLAYMLASGGMFAGNLAAGRWLSGVDLRRAFAAATACLAAAWGVVYVGTPSLPVTLAAATGAAFASGVGWIALSALLAAETPAGRGTTMALNSALFAAGSAIGGAAGGLLVTLGGYALLGTILPLATLAAALLAWRPRPMLGLALARRWLAARAD